MPFKSQAQRRKFAEMMMRGEISPETFEEWNRETGSAKLPERVGAKRTRKKTARKTAAKKPARKTTREKAARKRPARKAARKRAKARR
jgi:hypothetical protein